MEFTGSHKVWTNSKGPGWGERGPGLHRRELGMVGMDSTKGHTQAATWGPGEACSRSGGSSNSSGVWVTGGSALS